MNKTLRQIVLENEPELKIFDCPCDMKGCPRDYGYLHKYLEYEEIHYNICPETKFGFRCIECWDRTVDFEEDGENDMENNKKEMVNHPSHYKAGKYECIEVMKEVFGTESVKSFCLCNSFKYLWRTKKKNGEEDLKKAAFYLNEYLKMCDGEEEVPSVLENMASKVDAENYQLGGK